MANWPATIFDFTVMKDMTLASGVGYRTTQTDTGHRRTHRVSTVPRDQLTASAQLTSADCETLNTFYKTTLKEGTVAFDHVHPFTGSAQSYRFTAPPQYRHLPTSPVGLQRSPNRWFTVGISLELVP